MCVYCTGWNNCDAAQSLPHPPSKTQGVSTQLEEGSSGTQSEQDMTVYLTASPLSSSLSPSSSPLPSSLPPSSSPLPSSLPPSSPPKEYARMVQMLQGYCLVCTGVRITCHDQSGKGYATTCELSRVVPVLCHTYSSSFSLSSFFSFLSSFFSPLTHTHSHPSPVRNSW